MNKFIIKLVVMLLIAVGVSNFGLYLMTGKTPFSGIRLPDIQAPSLSDVTPLEGEKETAYKWTDENGLTHYSNEPPPNSHSAEIIEVDPNTNLVRGIEITEKVKPEATSEIVPVQGPIYSPETINQLMDNARNVEKVLQERHDQQEELLNSM